MKTTSRHLYACRGEIELTLVCPDLDPTLTKACAAAVQSALRPLLGEDVSVVSHAQRVANRMELPAKRGTDQRPSEFLCEARFSDYLAKWKLGRPSGNKWRMLKDPKRGQVHALPGSAGIAVATNGVLVLIRQSAGGHYIGHFGNFVADKEPPKPRQVRDKAPTKPKVVAGSARAAKIAALQALLGDYE